jgi:hypothetical protein
MNIKCDTLFIIKQLARNTLYYMYERGELDSKEVDIWFLNEEIRTANPSMQYFDSLIHQARKELEKILISLGKKLTTPFKQ